MALSNAAREARNAYQREYRRRYPEKGREYNRRYWERKAEKLADPVYQVKALQGEGLTQRKIADMTGMSLSAVNRILKQKSVKSERKPEQL